MYVTAVTLGTVSLCWHLQKLIFFHLHEHDQRKPVVWEGWDCSHTPATSLEFKCTFSVLPQMIAGSSIKEINQLVFLGV